MKHKSLLICTLAISALTTAQTPQEQKPVNLGRTGFYENKGQIVDQNYKPNPAVKYLFCSPDFNVQLKQTGFSYDTYTDEFTQPCPAGKATSAFGQPIQDKFKAPQAYTRHFHRVDIELVGCNASAQIVAEEKSNAYYNYMTAGTPEGGVSDIHYYQKVTYKNIYPSIDLEFTTRTATVGVPVEYNFIVHPGGNPADIKLAYSGANRVSLDNNKLVVNVAAGDFTENIPYSYFKDTKQIALINYVATGKNTFGFSISTSQLSTLNSSSDLIIDPVPNLSWGTYYGGVGANEGNGIVIDASDNVYVTGWTNSGTAIATVGGYQNTLGGSIDAFVAKFNPTGSALLWGTYYGGANDDYAQGIALDASDNVYISGYTASSTGISTAGAYQVSYGGTTDAFVAKFSSNGATLLWGTYYGGTGTDEAYGIALDASDNVYITGETSSNASIATAGAYQQTFGGNYDVFAAKFNSSGSALVWGTYYGGSLAESGLAIALDASNNVYITGETQSTTGISTAGANQPSFGGGSTDAFVAKINSTGSSLVWGTYYGGTGFDYGYGITLDASNNVYITGYTSSSSAIATAGAYQTVLAGGYDVCVAKFNSNGTSLVWGTYYGGTGFDYSYGITLDASDNVYITGFTASTTGIATVGGYQVTYGGGTYDAFVSKFNPTGSSLLWGTYYGGTNADQGWAIALDASDNVYTTGATFSTASIATVGAYQITGNGVNGDVFVAKFSGCSGAPAQPGAISGPVTACNGSVITYKIAPVVGATSYTWTLPAGWGGASTADSIIATVGANGGTISVTATNLCGTSTAQTLTVAVNNVGVTITPVNEHCFGDCNGTATANPTGTGPFTYVWSNTSTASAITSLCIGSYTVTVTGLGGCTATVSASITQPTALNITQGSIPPSTASSCDGSVWAVTSGGTAPYTYLWNPGGATSDTVKNACDGNYCCHITDHNGCMDSICVSIATGIPSIADLSSVKIFPNPGNGYFTITGLAEGEKIEMYDYLGQKLNSVIATDADMYFNLSDKANGIYLIRITDKDSSVVTQSKMIKQQ